MKFFKALNVDLHFLIPVFILAVFSLMTLWNITPLLGADVAGINFFRKQLIGFILGAITIAFIYNLNLKKFNGFINLVYFILIAMLVILAFKPPIIGDMFVVHINGANGWFKIFNTGIKFQPVEFFKVAMVLKLAMISKEHLSSFTQDDWLIKNYFIYGGIPIFLILLEPDLGGFFLLGFTFLIMFLFSLKNRKIFRFFIYIIIGVLIFVILLISSDAFASVIVKISPLHSYQLARIDAWLDPFSTEEGYQLSQSLIFMGSAGPFGYGGGFDQISFPEAQTDLIFTTFVGFYGWILGGILILIYAFLNIRIFTLASLQKDPYLKLIAVGYGALFFIQVVENIGMLIGVLPITGIVLPFMSYGVSALLTYSIIIGILLNISRETDFDPTKYNKL